MGKNGADKQIIKAIEENIRLGYMELAGIDENGEKTFRLTEAGKKYVEDMIKKNMN